MTENYLCHFRLKGGIDLQFGCRRKIRKKVGEQELYGPWMPDQSPRKVPYFKSEASEYGVRIEYNPNKVKDYSALQRFLKFVCKMNPFWQQDLEEGRLLKLSRHDIAIDYPLEIDPTMYTSRARKMSIFMNHEGVQTVYFGTRRSKKQLRVYNKRDEIIEQGEGFCLNEHLWRFELARNETFLLDEKDFYEDPFKDVHYFDYEVIQKNIDNFTNTERLILLAAKGVDSTCVGFGVDYVVNTLGSSSSYKRRVKREIKRKFASCYNSSPSPSEIFAEQFAAQWDAQKTRLKSFFTG